MTYLQLFIFLTLSALLAYRCIGGIEKKPVFTGEHNGHKLSVFEYTTTVGLGAYSHTALLFWDNKELTRWHHTWPIQPEMYPDWVVKTFSEATESWTIYVSPKKHTRNEFDQIVACYEANKPAMDAAMQAQFTKYDTERYRIIGRFIYGEQPLPMVFKPTLQRYQPFLDGDFTIKAILSREELVVQPDGKWELNVVQSENGHSFGGNLVVGQIILENGRPNFKMPSDNYWVEFPGMIRTDAVSRTDYLRSSVNESGKRLDEVFVFQ